MSLFGHLSSSNGIVSLTTSDGLERSSLESERGRESGVLNRFRSPRKRTYVGTIGAPCDVVLSVNQQRVAGRAILTLPSGASLRIGEDGAWLYSPRPDSVTGSAVSMDTFSYVLQTPSGPISGSVNVFLSPVPADHQILTRSYGMVSAAHGDGSSAACPLTLRFRIVTGTTVLLDARDDSSSEIDGDLAVVLLSKSKCVTALVQSDGLISIRVGAGYCGEASCTVLVETVTGRSEWLDIALDVIPACLFTDHRTPGSVDNTMPRCDVSTPAIVSKVIVPHSSTIVIRGTCRPSGHIQAKIEGVHGKLCAQSIADVGGYWEVTFHDVPTGCECRFTVEDPLSSDRQGELQVSPSAGCDYREV